MPRFIYNAYGVAVAGRITRPINCELEPAGVCVLPPNGGKVVSQAGPFSLTDPVSGEFLLSYGSAETSIEGLEISKNLHRTVLVTTVRDINVGNVLKADEITAKLMLHYHDDTDRVEIDAAGSRFVNLTIGGEPFEVQVDDAMAREASDYKKFKEAHRELKQKQGKITWVLGRNKHLTPDEDGEPHRRQPNFGRIYFAEWQTGPGTQRLTMLRLRLGSPQAGDIEFGDGGANGQSYP
ncbi:MAG: choice-of-anchor P family protein [Rhodospirillales bacterium]